jgi:hypothetical protein
MLDALLPILTASGTAALGPLLFILWRMDRRLLELELHVALLLKGQK